MEFRKSRTNLDKFLFKLIKKMNKLLLPRNVIKATLKSTNEKNIYLPDRNVYDHYF